MLDLDSIEPKLRDLPSDKPMTLRRVVEVEAFFEMICTYPGRGSFANVNLEILESNEEYFDKSSPYIPQDDNYNRFKLTLDDYNFKLVYEFARKSCRECEYNKCAFISELEYLNVLDLELGGIVVYDSDQNGKILSNDEIIAEFIKLSKDQLIDLDVYFGDLECPRCSDRDTNFFYED